MQKLKVALQGIANRKASGSDGLPVDFYKWFWDVVAGSTQ